MPSKCVIYFITDLHRIEMWPSTFHLSWKMIINSCCYDFLHNNYLQRWHGMRWANNKSNIYNNQLFLKILGTVFLPDMAACREWLR